MIPILRWLALAAFNVWASVRFINQPLVFIPIMLAIHNILFPIYLYYSLGRRQPVKARSCEKV